MRLRRALLIGLVMALAIPSTALAHDAERQDRPVRTVAAVIQEWNLDGTSSETTPTLGASRLTRRADGLESEVRMRGLMPGGVYTFWWVVVQRDGTFPDDIFVALGGSVIVSRSGRVVEQMRAELGQESITGFSPDGVNEIVFAQLHDPLDSTVRIEIAYHGQAADAGDDLAVWLSDFWTGSACPGPIGSQPHCPVFYAATHG